MSRAPISSAGTVALAVAPLLLFSATVRQPLEAGMALHMLLLPMVAASGCAMVLCLKRAGIAPSSETGIDAGGLLGLTAASCVFAFWMLPVSLDLTLLWAPIAGAKYLSLWAGGLMLAASVARAPPEVLAFFAGNASLMLASAGLLFMESETRLCLSYRYDEQQWAGGVLIALAIALGLAAAARVRHAMR